MNLPTFDELYVLSDLHLGGDSGFQIFTSTEEAAALLAHLSRIKKSRVGLVINGDLVDFLAEQGARAFNPDQAESMLRRIAEDKAFAPVFAGLREFTAGENHRLIINLGNHDIELALPWVRRVLLSLVAGSDGARGRVELAFEGTGYAACVGTARVLCLHGNEVDEWNVTDFEKLRLQGRDSLQGKAMAEEWRPNAGSRMVVEVMNGIKRVWPFVDLLKPEQEAVPPVLIALDPALTTQLSGIAALLAVAKVDKAKMAAGFLSAPAATAEKTGPSLGEPPAPGADSAANPLMEAERRLRDTFFKNQAAATAATRSPSPSSRETPQVSDLLLRIEAEFDKDIPPVDLLAGDREQQYLGTMSAAWSWLNGKDSIEVLRAALDGLLKDHSFDLDNEDSTFKKVDEKVGPGFDFVITGHTHLERARPRRHGSGFYYNVGTWVGLMKFTAEMLNSPEQFRSVFHRLAQRSIAALETEPSLVLRHNSFVKISRVSPNGPTLGELQRAQIRGENGLTMETVPGSKHTIA
ncbi:MAG: hypothetical protein B7Z52_00440 [Burkholderiales bacterium 12-64-5]|nr:MAG: hypothetical protein B7Z52_00440 [Burkholderiales bacterium 12-64-5]